MGLFERTKYDDNKEGVPVWFMRQAGRYHDHYQNIKKNSDFMTMCRNPKLACEVTHGPIDDFKFDAAILFSDLLFPLEYMGLGLEYNPGPKLGFHIETMTDIKKINPQGDAREFFKFQGDACKLLKESLAKDKTLLGFVGAPFTLYAYAAEGGHGGNLTEAKKGFYDGRWNSFLEILIPTVLDEMFIQAEGGADGMCLFDTAVGELDRFDFKEFILPALKTITREFKKKHPHVKVIYYSKLTHLDYLKEIEEDSIDVLGIDWRHDLGKAIKELGNDYYIQGNIDPSHLHLPWEILEKKWENLKQNVESANAPMNKWICGLGHGVLQRTPEINVKKSVEWIHQNLRY